ncbi:MAG: DUF2142 domain-containing protein [Microthrixaceae bacterium]
MRIAQWVSSEDHESGPSGWWVYFGLFAVCGLVWMLANPLMTGPDELFQARRAAAVARGEFTGEEGPQAPLLVEVQAPEAYLTGDEVARCFYGEPVPNAPVDPISLFRSSCPKFQGGDTLVAVSTGQYRGQPFYYWLAGLPTLLSPGALGAYAMRAVGVALSAALLASAAVSVGRSASPTLAGLGLLGAVAPGVLYLAASTNPSSVEIAAALSAWATGALLVQPRSDIGAREVARFGVAMVVLVAVRGLGPLFGASVVVALGVVAGPQRSRQLIGRRDVQAWAAATALATLASIAWLRMIQDQFPLPSRPGSGLATAVSYLPWYLHQSVGVFGQNDSAVPAQAAWLYVLVVAGVAAVGLARSPTRTAAVAAATLLAGIALSLTAEGLSLPPIGFFWQGRYALPLLLGGVVLATCRARPRSTTASDDPVAPWDTADLLARPETGRFVVRATLLVMVVVHGVAFVSAARHHAAKGGGPQAILSALTAPRWAPPVPFWILLIVYLAALVGVARRLTARTGD